MVFQLITYDFSFSEQIVGDDTFLSRHVFFI